MQIGILYFIVIILANSLGALTGMGGGVIIKPVFDAIGIHDVLSISFYSSIAVFTMSIVSTIRQYKNGVRFKMKALVWIIFGSILGGFLGNVSLEQLVFIFQSESQVQWIQIIITVVSLMLSFVYTAGPKSSLQLKGGLWYSLVGVILGFLASFLGIGGGPINVALFMFCFGLPIKKATVYSILTILFSQASKLITIHFTTGFMLFDLTILFYIIPAAILGGLVGSRLSKLLPDQSVLIAYQTVVIFVILLNLGNGIFAV